MCITNKTESLSFKSGHSQEFSHMIPADMYLTMTLCDYFCSFVIGIPPDIDEGPFVPQPDDFMLGNMTVKIGTPVYVVDGFDITIVCNVVNGTTPITITWLRNGIAEPTIENVSTITVDDYKDGDVFTCRADNIAGFDMDSTTIIGEL